MNEAREAPAWARWRTLLHEVIFQADTPAGKGSDVVLIAIIAVPTGIATVEMSHTFGTGVSTQACPQCSAEGHDVDARQCKYCGAAL